MVGAAIAHDVPRRFGHDPEDAIGDGLRSGGASFDLRPPPRLLSVALSGAGLHIFCAFDPDNDGIEYHED